MKTKLIPFNIEAAQAGAKIVTRCGRRVRIGFFDLKDEEHPIVGAVETDGGEVVCSFTKDGRRAVEDEESRNDAFKNVFDLFIEEEVDEEPNNFEIMPDEWYLCTREACLWLEDGINYTSFMEGVPYSGSDILKCNLSFEPKYYQKYFKPWNICYAKPGDILASKNRTTILIFKQIDTATSFSSYYNMQHRRDDCWANNYFIPATKEQCSQIFKKMKEEGYEWDSERNELKEIATDKAEEEGKTRLMTRQELADWLRDAPEEHREFRYVCSESVYSNYDYPEDEADTPEGKVFIRRNHGEWEKPLVEI